MASETSLTGVRGWWARQSRKRRGIYIAVAVVLGIALIGNIFGRGEEVPPPAADPPPAEPTSEPEAEVEDQSTEDDSAEPEPETDDALTPAPEEETPEAPVEEVQGSIADYANELLLEWYSPDEGPTAATWDELAGTYTTVYSPSEVDFDTRRVLYGASDSWPAMVSSIEDYTDTMLRVNLNVHSQSPDWDQDEIGRFAANSVMITVGPERENLEYVLVFSSDGVEIGSVSRASSTMQ